jgi:hypothetical protein
MCQVKIKYARNYSIKKGQAVKPVPCHWSRFSRLLGENHLLGLHKITGIYAVEIDT